MSDRPVGFPELPDEECLSVRHHLFLLLIPRTPSEPKLCDGFPTPSTDKNKMRSALAWASPRFANGNAKGERSSRNAIASPTLDHPKDSEKSGEVLLLCDRILPFLRELSNG